MHEAIPALGGLSELSPRYDALLCDVWGVIHNGVRTFPGAAEALARFREAGGAVVLITNAPRPSGDILDMLRGLGVDGSSFDALVSSGDVTRAMIAPYRGRIVHHVGPEHDDDALYEGLGVIRGRAEDAEVVVVTDLDTDFDTPDMYDERMALWRARGLPMIVANPDRVVEHGERLIYCGGALGDAYAARGGQVHMAGKPFAPIYEHALELAGQAFGGALDRPRVLAIGDSARTDATGAAAFDIDLLFITGSIHAGELDAFGTPDPKAVAGLLEPTGARAVGFMPRLIW